MQVQFEFGATDTSRTPCRVCGGTAESPVVRVIGAPTESGTLDLYRCAACLSLSYAGDKPVIGYDFQGFAENYWHHYVQSGAGIMAMLEPLLRLRPRGGKLLDVGCGFGFVPHFWQTSGLGSAVGLETSEYGHIGRQKLGIDIRHSYYAPLKADLDGCFRYVFASEVLEHVPNPKDFLAEISGGLDEDGILILTTPAAEGVVLQCDSTTLLASLSPGFHYFLTSRMGLAHLLHQSGFRHVKVEMAGTRLFAWASHRPLPTLAPAGEGWENYIAYLELLSEHPDHHVAGGARYRFFKDALNTGDLGRASKGWLALQDLAKKQYDINLFAGSADAETEPSQPILQPLKIPDFSKSPSWLGCALFFAAKYYHSRGERLHELAPVLCRAISEIGRDLDDLAQFAQEPAHFLPQARELLARILAGSGSPLKVGNASDFGDLFQKCRHLLQSGNPRRAEHMLWHALAEAVDKAAGAESEACIWLALANTKEFDLGQDVEEICFEAAIARRPEDAKLHAAAGVFAFAKGRYRRAYSAFRIVCNADPLNSGHWSNLAACALLLTCHRLARAHALTALSHNPGNILARKILVRTEVLLQRPTAALEALAPLERGNLDNHLLEISVSLVKGNLQTGLFDLAELAESAPDSAEIRKQFHEAFCRSLNDPALIELIDALNLSVIDEANEPPSATCDQKNSAPELCDVVVFADPEQVNLRGCLESLALNGSEWIDRVSVVAHPQRVCLADLEDLPFQVRMLSDLNAAFRRGTSRQILLICAEAALLPDTIAPLFRCLNTWPTAAIAAAWPLAGPSSAHPMPLDRQSEEPIPDATLTAAIREWTRGPTEVQVPLVPAGCLLIRRDALELLGALDAQPISGAVQDLSLRAIDAGRKVFLVLDAPVALCDRLPPPNRASLFTRYSALRVLAAECLMDRMEPIAILRQKIQQDLALNLPSVPPDVPPPVSVRSVQDGAVRDRWLTAPPQPASKTDEICLFVAFAPDGTLPPLTIRYLMALRSEGLRVVLCLNMSDPDAPADQSIASLADHVLLRTNKGYDFAGWADLLREQPGLWNAGLIIFANDSLIGPLDGFGQLINRVRRSPGDFIAMTDSTMYRPHVQSFLFAYKRGGLSSDVIRDFWAGIEILADKQEVIQRYELALRDVAKTQAKLQIDVLFPTESILGHRRRRMIGLSPTHHLWRPLLRMGFPFVKAELLRGSTVGVRGSDVLQALMDLGLDVEELCLHIEETNLNRLPLTVCAGPPATAEWR